MSLPDLTEDEARHIIDALPDVGANPADGRIEVQG